MDMNYKFKFKQTLGSDFEMIVMDGTPKCITCKNDDNCKHIYFSVTNSNILDEFHKKSIKIDPVKAEKIKQNWRNKSLKQRFFR